MLGLSRLEFKDDLTSQRVEAAHGDLLEALDCFSCSLLAELRNMLGVQNDLVKGSQPHESRFPRYNHQKLSHLA